MSAEALFYLHVKRFAENAREFDPMTITYDVKPDEEFNVPLVSERVYGVFHETLAVMAAAGLSGPQEPLYQTRIYLPSKAKLFEIKRKTGYESDPDMIDKRTGKPLWQN